MITLSLHLGAEIPLRSCRNTTLWHLLLQRLNATRNWVATGLRGLGLSDSA